MPHPMKRRLKSTFIIQLFDAIISENVRYHDSMEKVESELKEHEEKVGRKFIDHPKVKDIAQGKRAVFIPKINLLCELESRVANKITMEIIHEDFSLIKNLLHSLSTRMIKEGLGNASLVIS